MGGGTDKSGDPRTMNEREHEHFDEHCGVIRVADIVEWARRDHAHSRRIHHLHIPMFAEGANHPPANHIGGNENRQANAAKNRVERPMKEHDLERGADQYACVKQDHPAKTGIDYFLRAVRDHVTLVAPGYSQFQYAQEGDDKEEDKISDYAQFHCSNKNSALKPGPNAAAIACSPAFKGRFSNHS